jgi:hypothetical protein
VSIYVLVAIVRKRLELDMSLYQILQILSVTLFEKTPILGSSLFGVGCVRATGAMPAELDPLARRRRRPTGGVATTSSFMVLVFL